jgi:ribulose-5-phosphate 4-epimerase/fuculose-1-phosphate aldolase
MSQTVPPSAAADLAADLAVLRRDLAAALRLADHFGFSEGICNHFSAVVPGVEERYLINAYGWHWSEIRPSDLLLIDGEGRVIEGQGEVEATARNIHVAGHRANPRHKAILHVHMPYATAIGMTEGGRLEMAHQTAARFHGRVAYEAFGGLALDESEGERIAAGAKANPDADVFFLANHGVTCCAPSVALAFDELYYLERACRQQVLAMSTGRPLRLIPEPLLSHTAAQYRGVLAPQAELFFAALRRVHGL